jgi:cytochrome b
MSVPETKSVRVWDWPTRAFHWLLVFCMISAWASHKFAPALGDVTLKWHRWNGYAILVLLVFRLLWGVLGSSTSRFSHFIRGPFFTLRYALDFAGGKKRPFLGHNPLGTVMIVVLLVAVLVQGVLGLFTLEHNEIVAGPLKRLISDETTELVSKWHLRGFNILLVFVAIHISANIAYALIAREPMIRAMVSGKKPALPYEDGIEAEIADNVSVRAVACFLIAIALVFGGITALGGRIF